MCTVCVCQQLSYRYLLGNLVGCCQCACLLQLCPELAGPAISAWTEGEFNSFSTVQEVLRYTVIKQ